MIKVKVPGGKTFQIDTSKEEFVTETMKAIEDGSQCKGHNNGAGLGYCAQHSTTGQAYLDLEVIE